MRYSADEVERLGPGKTDWERLDALTDKQIETAMRGDPEWADLIDFDWSDAVAVTPKRKRAISIRLDKDVISFFKADGDGYQTRMNAVLRHFMQWKKKFDAAE